MADHTLFAHKSFRQTTQSHRPVGNGRLGSQFVCGTKGGGKSIGLAGALPRERTLSGNVYTPTGRSSRTSSFKAGRSGQGPGYIFSTHRQDQDVIPDPGAGPESLAPERDEPVSWVYRLNK
ncbi:hypothetical protein MTP99_015837 [Tenebrio molitor]|nr:hypothetical protein MTP99_015837 [Tenebrio molitor]